MLIFCYKRQYSFAMHVRLVFSCCISCCIDFSSRSLCFLESYWTMLSYFPSLVFVFRSLDYDIRCGNAESILQLDPPTNAAIGAPRALRRAATSKNPTTCTLPSDVISHDLIHHLSYKPVNNTQQ